jgi:hypothetical protein
MLKQATDLPRLHAPRRFPVRIVAPLSLAAVLGASCVSSDNSVFIETAVSIDGSNNCLPEKNGAKPLPSGTLDVLSAVAATPVGRGYQTALQVVTNLPATFTNADVNNQQQSPNYQDYGPTDNNVMVFQSGKIAFSFANEPGVAPAGFDCNDVECTRDGQNPRVTGTVFNLNNALGTKGVVFLEAVAAADAVALATAVKGILAPNGIPNPAVRKRVIAEITLTAQTTGSGELRPITTFPFPFAIDLCAGCLVPDDAVCSRARGDRVEADGADNVCFAGQDIASFECDCDGASCF